MDALYATAAGIPAFLLYFIVALVFAAVFAGLYVQITPQHEISLIRDGKRAAAISFAGALIGFALPLAKSIEQSRNLADMLVWSAVALLVQLLAFFIASLVAPGLGRRISAGDEAAAIVAAAVAIGIGLLNAACMTY